MFVYVFTYAKRIILQGLLSNVFLYILTTALYVPNQLNNEHALFAIQFLRSDYLLTKEILTVVL